MIQAQAARGVGFELPKTIVRNDAAAVTSFLGPDEKILTKPVRSGSAQEGRMVYSQRVEREFIVESAQQLKFVPHIFQAYVEKAYELRVSVVGEQVFAAKIDSQKDERSQVGAVRQKRRSLG